MRKSYYKPRDKVMSKCLECGKPIKGRVSKRFCSGRCNIKNWRKRQGQ